MFNEPKTTDATVHPYPEHAPHIPAKTIGRTVRRRGRATNSWCFQRWCSRNHHNRHDWKWVNDYRECLIVHVRGRRAWKRALVTRYAQICLAVLGHFATILWGPFQQSTPYGLGARVTSLRDARERGPSCCRLRVAKPHAVVNPRST
jgi:hypothetical protein